MSLFNTFWKHQKTVDFVAFLGRINVGAEIPVKKTRVNLEKD